MTDYVETFLGDVHTWEVDATEHFTVAYYYEKFQSATWRFLTERGIDPQRASTASATTQYKSELRNRDIFRIETAVIEAGSTPTLAHRMVNAETGEVCTHMQQTLTGVPLAGPTAEWTGDPVEARSIPEDSARWLPTLRDVVLPGEVDWSGRLGLPGYIHRFSTANSFIMAACGLTPTYMTEHRFGLSTFEFQLMFSGDAKPGDLVNIDSCIAQLGGSSLRLYHRVSNATRGERIAGLSQFGVQLDLDARRPARIADDIRERATKFVAN
ncbi:MAG: thioesterase family protein [Pseudomonadota bacterium]